MSKVILQTQTAPGTPESGLSNLYVDSTTKRLATKDDAGNVVNYGTQNPFILPNDNNAVIIADTDNLSPGNYDVLRMVLTGNYNLTGISGGTDGRILVLTVTSTTNYLTLKNENSNSDAGNRFTIGADFVIHPTRSVILYYDSSSSRWKIASPTLFSDSEGDPEAIGTAADGTSIYAARRDHVHGMVTGSAALGSAFTLNASNGTYQDTGLSVTLPSAGTYNIDCVIRGVFNDSGTGGYISAKLYNSTDSADVANTGTLVLYYNTGAGTTAQATVPLMTSITVAASKTIKLYAQRTTTGTPGATLIDSNSNGYTTMRYTRTG